MKVYILFSFLVLILGLWLINSMDYEIRAPQSDHKINISISRSRRNGTGPSGTGSLMEWKRNKTLHKNVRTYYRQWKMEDRRSMQEIHAAAATTAASVTAEHGTTSLLAKIIIPVVCSFPFMLAVLSLLTGKAIPLLLWVNFSDEVNNHTSHKYDNGTGVLTTVLKNITSVNNTSNN